MIQQWTRHISWTNLAKSRKLSPWAIHAGKPGKPMDGLSCNATPPKMLAQPLELKGIRWYLDYFLSVLCLPQRRPSATLQSTMSSECVWTKLGLLPFARHMFKITVTEIGDHKQDSPASPSLLKEPFHQLLFESILSNPHVPSWISLSTIHASPI